MQFLGQPLKTSLKSIIDMVREKIERQKKEWDAKIGAKDKGNKRKHGSNPTISIITLNVRGLNAPMNRRKMWVD